MTRKLFLIGILAFISSCRSNSKDADIPNISLSHTVKNNIIYENYTDNIGENIIIATDKKNNSKTIKLNGSSYILEKDAESSSYSTNDNEYQLTESKNEITFLRKDYNMVIFKTKKLQ